MLIQLFLLAVTRTFLGFSWGIRWPVQTTLACGLVRISRSVRHNVVELPAFGDTRGHAADRSVNGVNQGHG